MPLASLGAMVRHLLQSLDEHGMSWRRYTSRTIFWTFPFLVDRTKVLLEMLLAKGSASAERLRLVMLAADPCVWPFQLAMYVVSLRRPGFVAARRAGRDVEAEF